MQQGIVTLKNVKKIYKTGDSVITALDTTNVSFETNKLTLIMGPSGSGKTTLLSILGFVIYPTAGDVFYKETHVNNLKESDLAQLRLHEIGFVFQQFNLIEPLNALENVIQPLILQGITKKEAIVRASRALDEVGLSTKMKTLPKRLSGGQKQRVAIARALVTNPAMILCDEPTASLDAKSATSIMQELKTLASKNKAVIIVTHDLRLRKYADKVIYVEEGKVSDVINNEQDYK
ncbi:MULTISPECIES: ABC transporter ATP-binding protein [Sphingobacterium]|uniref:ABC transporter ATP-binding protein n=1 Tax=Sphingobacterium kitahiroshimense TaxID=470446 RepID=A0ABV0BQV0_9SPHI|nr:MULTISPECIES: ABC transporter ATP-binding protein [Sphingobacterium]MBB2952298.1 putative ABC transport system ATP-binding protein [Sphingobacterium sp. JUb56]MCS3553688.1 putative ABC transport system ATP-binding protein [Sphingobacterium sp. JUb21]MCW2260758.1 putative ABC transport system ATP-binding protein [Sphingobacterium kitahiroshimense]NJI75717.1 ABC transporter ATP-binding protein [Sphingobacterium sp. B16(2022)]QQD13324.1 ABC transporter ATP-binding protein [Sphingobacterium sp.